MVSSTVTRHIANELKTANSDINGTTQYLQHSGVCGEDEALTLKIVTISIF